MLGRDAGRRARGASAKSRTRMMAPWSRQLSPAILPARQGARACASTAAATASAKSAIVGDEDRLRRACRARPAPADRRRSRRDRCRGRRRPGSRTGRRSCRCRPCRRRGAWRRRHRRCRARRSCRPARWSRCRRRAPPPPARRRCGRSRRRRRCCGRGQHQRIERAVGRRHDHRPRGATPATFAGTAFISTEEG